MFGKRAGKDAGTGADFEDSFAVVERSYDAIDDSVGDKKVLT